MNPKGYIKVKNSRKLFRSVNLIDFMKHFTPIIISGCPAISSEVRGMFKVNSKYTRKMSLTSFWYLYC